MEPVKPIKHEPDQDPKSIPSFGVKIRTDENDSAQDGHSDDEEFSAEEAIDAPGIEEEFKELVDEITNRISIPYNPANETMPRLPAYHPSFKKVEALAGELLQDALKLFQATEYRDESLQGIIEQILATRSIKYPPPLIIEMIGDSGVGKSSLINSILDTPELAFEGANGSACTAVITEYRQAFPRQATPFMAKIFLFAPMQIEHMLQSHFRSYYAYNLERNDNKDQETLDELELDSTTALETFLALFADHEEFYNDDAATGFLKTSKSADDSIILRKLGDWVVELKAKFDAKDDLIEFSADTVEDLTTKVAGFVKTCSPLADDDDRRSPSPWPIVRIVRIGLRAPLLERSIILADLPGLSDVNKTRTRSTQAYKRRCHRICLVAPVARVQTDNLVHQRLLQAHREFGRRKFLLCTKIDDLSRKAKPNDLGASAEASAKHTRMMQAYRFAATKKSYLEKEIQHVKSKDKRVISKQITQLGLISKAYGALLHGSLVEMRNQKVRTAMRKKYKSLTSDPAPLMIGFVSNTGYASHCEGYDKDEIPIPLKLTGIPDTAPSHIAARLKEIECILEECLLDKIKASRGDWIKKANESFNDWTKLDSRTFSAWCRHEGAHSTKTTEYFSWNADLLEPIIRDTAAAWESFERKLEDLKEDYYISLVALLDEIRENLNAIPGVSIEPMAPFMASLTPKKIELRKVLEHFFRKVKALSKTTKLDVITEEEGSFLMQSMRPIYAQCAQKKGTGTALVQRAILEYAISKGEPFNKIYAGVKGAFGSWLLAEAPKLLEKLKIVFNDVVKNFDHMFVIEEIHDPRRDLLRLQIQQFVTEAKAKINGPLTEELAIATKDST